MIPLLRSFTLLTKLPLRFINLHHRDFLFFIFLITSSACVCVCEVHRLKISERLFFLNRKRPISEKDVKLVSYGSRLCARGGHSPRGARVLVPRVPRARRRQVRPPRLRLRPRAAQGSPGEVCGAPVTSPHLIRALPFSFHGPRRRLALSPRPQSLVSGIPLSFPGLAGFIIPPEQSGRPVAEGR